MNQQELWQKCVAFHGHQCGGLTIGYKASLYAIELLQLTFSEDEQVVCIAGKTTPVESMLSRLFSAAVSAKEILLFPYDWQTSVLFFYNRSTGQISTASIAR